MKTIVDKSLINSDPKLKIVKDFRITNKRAGEAKRKGPEGQNEYLTFCAQLRDIAVAAETQGFKIWVNPNGRTGHTYEKDYKETPDIDNNYEEFRNAIRTLYAAEIVNSSDQIDAEASDEDVNN